MDMHAAALPPIHGTYTAQDEKHPRFPEYRAYRQGMTRLMVRAEGFRDWLASKERQEGADHWGEHPQYPDFLAWMREHQGGARPCPGNRVFPANFQFWLQGGRW